MRWMGASNGQKYRKVSSYDCLEAARKICLEMTGKYQGQGQDKDRKLHMDYQEI